ncbi:MAG TPA: MarR family transcriptional regulator [Acidimicrobiales bacterium]|jgi:DNA-binding MarR family transcriptional regulator|nr:MarR family transcriptional regulator [Acidimicrobiales bacterium]
MTEPRWLDDGEQRAWRGLLSAQRELRSRTTRRLQRETGLSESDYEVLVNLSEAPSGRLRAYELGRATKWEKSRLSHHLTRMADRGLVARESCPTDNRGAFIVITKAGRAAITDAAPLHVDHVRELFVDALTPAQLDALADATESILAHLAETDPDALGEAACDEGD